MRERSKFGDVLYKEFLLPYNMTQKDLAEESGVAESDLSRMVTGQRFAYGQTLYDDMYAILKAISDRASAEGKKPILDKEALKLLETIPSSSRDDTLENYLCEDLRKKGIVKHEYYTDGDRLLVGLDDEINLVYERLLGNERLLTLLGTGGVGKTEIARQIQTQARKLKDFGQVFFVSLESVRDIDKVLPTITQEVMGDKEGDAQRLIAKLQSKRTLLVLDNFEQVSGARRDLFELLNSCYNLTILVTSRVLFHPQVHKVLPLSIPDKPEIVELAPETLSGMSVDKSSKIIERLRNYDGIKLFERTVQVRDKSFVITSENAYGVARLCIALDGLPLALRLVGSRVPDLKLEGVYRQFLGGTIHELKDIFTDIERHVTLDALIRVTYELLKPAEKGVFRIASFSEKGQSFFWLNILGQYGDFEPTKPKLTNIALRLCDYCLATADGFGVRIPHNIIRDFGRRQLEARKEVEVLQSRYENVVLTFFD